MVLKYLQALVQIGHQNFLTKLTSAEAWLRIKTKERGTRRR